MIVRQGGVSWPILFIVWWTTYQIRTWSCWLLLVTLFCLSSWICRWRSSFGSLYFGFKNDTQYLLSICHNDYNLSFNPGVQFPSPSSSTSPIFLFVGQSLKLADHDRACHLGHILPSDLSDTDDILRAQTDMCHRANCFLSTFYAANPAIKTLLFRTFCLSLYGSALWRLSSSNLDSLEVTFNNPLRKIWKLPQHCRTSILHCTSSLQSLYNVVICRSHMLCQKARATRISLIRDIFTEAPQLSYTTFGFKDFK